MGPDGGEVGVPGEPGQGIGVQVASDIEVVVRSLSPRRVVVVTVPPPRLLGRTPLRTAPCVVAPHGSHIATEVLPPPGP